MANGKVGGTEAASVKFILNSRHCRALGGKLKLEPQAAVPRALGASKLKSTTKCEIWWWAEWHPARAADALA